MAATVFAVQIEEYRLTALGQPIYRSFWWRIEAPNLIIFGTEKHMPGSMTLPRESTLITELADHFEGARLAHNAACVDPYDHINDWETLLFVFWRHVPGFELQGCEVTERGVHAKPATMGHTPAERRAYRWLRNEDRIAHVSTRQAYYGVSARYQPGDVANSSDNADAGPSDVAPLSPQSKAKQREQLIYSFLCANDLIEKSSRQVMVTAKSLLQKMIARYKADHPLLQVDERQWYNAVRDMKKTYHLN